MTKFIRASDLGHRQKDIDYDDSVVVIGVSDRIDISKSDSCLQLSKIITLVLDQPIVKKFVYNGSSLYVDKIYITSHKPVLIADFEFVDTDLRKIIIGSNVSLTPTAWQKLIEQTTIFIIKPVDWMHLDLLHKDKYDYCTVYFGEDCDFQVEKEEIDGDESDFRYDIAAEELSDRHRIQRLAKSSLLSS